MKCRRRWPSGAVRLPRGRPLGRKASDISMARSSARDREREALPSWITTRSTAGPVERSVDRHPVPGAIAAARQRHARLVQGQAQHMDAAMEQRGPVETAPTAARRSLAGPGSRSPHPWRPAADRPRNRRSDRSRSRDGRLRATVRAQRDSAARPSPPIPPGPAPGRPRPRSPKGMGAASGIASLVTPATSPVGFQRPARRGGSWVPARSCAMLAAVTTAWEHAGWSGSNGSSVSPTACSR